MARTLIKVPATAKAGEVFEVRVTIAHPMETGYRPDSNGKILPRNIIRRMNCRYNGAPVFSAEMHAAMSANPYLAFFLKATASGPISFTWEGDNGFAQTETVDLKVT